MHTGCVRQNENHANFKIVKKPLLVRIQTIPQQKVLDLSFNLAPWKWAWHYQEAATPSRCGKHILLNFMGAEGFWLFDFYDLSRSQFLSYSHFQGVKLKLISRAFCWCIVCYSRSIDSFQILNSNIFRIRLLHPVDFSTLPVKMFGPFWSVACKMALAEVVGWVLFGKFWNFQNLWWFS